jgi:hypothetical protein
LVSAEIGEAPVGVLEALLPLAESTVQIRKTAVELLRDIRRIRGVLPVRPHLLFDGTEAGGEIGQRCLVLRSRLSRGRLGCGAVEGFLRLSGRLPGRVLDRLELLIEFAPGGLESLEPPIESRSIALRLADGRRRLLAQRIHALLELGDAGVVLRGSGILPGLQPIDQSCADEAAEKAGSNQGAGGAAPRGWRGHGVRARLGRGRFLEGGAA